MLRICWSGLLVSTVSVVLLGCGDGGTGPAQPDISGVYYGTSALGSATCDGEVPGGSDPSGFTIPLLLDVTQNGEQVSAADLGDTLHYVGTFTASQGGLAARFRVFPEMADYVVVVDSLTASVDRNPLVLTGVGQRVDTVHRETAGQPELHCTRSLAWNLTRRAEPVPELEPVDCSRESELRPEGSLGSTLMLFRNESQEPRDIYKLDPEGRRVLLEHLEPDDLVPLGALNNAVEPLVVTRTDGTCRAIYLPTEGPSYVTLQ